MIKYNGMKSEASSGNVGQLPAGPYVAKVLKIEVWGDAPDQQLVLKVDVDEGPFKDFFMNKFKAQSSKNMQYEVKFKGVYKLRIPNPDNKSALYPESDIRKMNDLIYRFEQSNPGFHWDGDEQKLKGLAVGINMVEDEFNGNAFTKIGRLEIVQDVRSGLVKPMKPRERKEEPAATDGVPSGFTPVELDQLPF